jgi:hypothetical protein
LRETLRAAPRCRDALAGAGGVAALLAAYAEDNAGVLATLAEACAASERCAAALAAACDAAVASPEHDHGNSTAGNKMRPSTAQVSGGAPPAPKSPLK